MAEQTFDNWFGPDGTGEPSPPPLPVDPLAGLVAGGMLTAEIDNTDDRADWIHRTDAQTNARPVAAEVAKPVQPDVDADEVRRAVAEVLAEQPPGWSTAGSSTAQRRPPGQPPTARAVPVARRRPPTPATAAGRVTSATQRRPSNARARKKMSPAQIVIMVLIAIVLLYNVLSSLVKWILSAFH
ncbi:MAG: hypothetical protein J2O49_02935 [Sciscionella sp.]|nr:hypothetical protein [Sciscionella sp.]